MITIKHQPATVPENTWPLCDWEMSHLGGFGPKGISLYCLIKWTSILAAQGGFDFAFHVNRCKIHSTTLQKNKKNHFYPSFVDQSWHTHNGNSGRRSYVMKEIADSSYSAMQIKFS